MWAYELVREEEAESGPPCQSFSEGMRKTDWKHGMCSCGEAPTAPRIHVSAGGELGGKSWACLFACFFERVNS